MHLKGGPGGKRNARRKRRELSLPEVLLWEQLRREPGGHYFRRQHAAGPYFLDFYCARARLCVEVDGEAHGFGDRPERDARRDAWLGEQGVRVLRIPAREVLRDLDRVVAHILEVIARG